MSLEHRYFIRFIIGLACFFTMAVTCQAICFNDMKGEAFTITITNDSKHDYKFQKENIRCLNGPDSGPIKAGTSTNLTFHPMGEECIYPCSVGLKISLGNDDNKAAELTYYRLGNMNSLKVSANITGNRIDTPRRPAAGTSISATINP